MLKYAVAGCGYVSGLHFQALDRVPQVKLVAVADRYEDLREKAKTEHGAERAFDSLERMLDEAEFDVLMIVTPTQFHCEHALMAADKGCAVLVEKPFCPTVEECRRVMAAYKESGNRLGVMHSSRYLYYARMARKLFGDGTLGRPLHLDAIGFHGPERPEGKDERFWRFNPGARGHGIAMNGLVHYADQVLNLTGQRAQGVTAVIRNFYSEGVVPEDNAHVMVRLANGTVATWRQVTGERGCGGRRQQIYYGSRGYLVNRNPFGETAELHVGRDTRELREEGAGGATTWFHMHSAFAAAFENGTPLPVTPDEGLAAVAVCEAAYRSSETGRTVTP